MESPVALTPSQRRVVDELMMAGRGARPHFPDDLARHLRAALHDALADAAHRRTLLDAELHVNHAELARVTQAGVLVVDFKSGRAYPHHIDDLRYYALLETFRSGVPPFRVASYYLDAGTWVGEDISEELLAITMRRVIDGVIKLAALRTNER